MKKLIFLVLLLSTSLAITCYSQMAKPVYRQFVLNPFQQNPAFAGMNGAALNMFYKRQWTGIKDSPSILGVSLQTSAVKQMVFGLRITADDQVILRNNSVNAAFAYVLPIAEDHDLRFGLSAGVDINAFNFTAEELDTNDPAILAASGNSFNMTGSFGLVYRRNGLKIGFAMTELFGANPFYANSYNKFSSRALQNNLISLSYRFNTDHFGRVAFEPYALLNQTSDKLNNYWEAGTLVHFHDKLWTGVSYNNELGPAVYFGFNLTDRFRLGYSYEFSSVRAGNSSHELQLKFKIGAPDNKQ